MKRKTILPALIVIIALIVIVVMVNKSDEKVVPQIVDETEVVVYEFYGATCPHCKHLNKWFEEVKPKYPNLKVMQYEVYSNQSNRQLFQKVAKAYGTQAGGVPAVFIGEEKFIGFGPDTGDAIELQINKCIEALCTSPAEELLR